MSYEPKGKMQFLLEAMRDAPDRIWSTAEAAEALGVSLNSVTAYTAYAVANGVIFRGGRCKAGGVRYALKPFTPAPQEAKTGRSKARPVPKWDPSGDLRVPRVVPGWTPPKMVCARLGG